MSDTKALFFDIDGTLITSYPYRIPESAQRALKAAQAKGHKIFINTGRTRTLLPSDLKKIGFDGYVCGCGSQVYIDGKLVHSATIPHDLCVKIIEKMRECRIPAVLECSDRLLFDGKGIILTKFLERLRTLSRIDDLSAFGKEESETYTFDKFYTHMTPESDVKIFREFTDPYLTCFEHSSTELEFTQKDYNKATGIQIVLNNLGLTQKDSYAFGDSTNDLPMLKYAGTSVAMGNSSPEILPYCTYQTTNIEDDGIFHALKHFDLI